MVIDKLRSKFERNIKRITNWSKKKKILVGVGGILVLGGIGVGSCFLYQHMNEPKKETEVVSVIPKQTKQVEQEVSVATETSVTVPTTTASAIETVANTEPISVKLVATSIERDLKIKVQNEQSKNIKGETFKINVTSDKTKKTVQYTDKDKDGIVYIKELEAGDYIVALEAMDGYYTKKDSIRVTVKDKIEYTPVEVKDEIKKESEVAPSEDAQKQEEKEVESVVKDTVESLTSDCNAKTTVEAASLKKEQYLECKASLGEVVQKEIPERTEEEKEDSALYASISMPETAKIYISKFDLANKLTLKITIDEKSDTNIIEKESIVWSFQDDCTNGLELENGKENSVILSATENTTEGQITVVATIPYTVDGIKYNTELACQVTVSKETYDSKKILKDSQGKTLYLDKKCSKVATIADLLEKEVQIFYADPIYTGWQTIDGKLYYYNGNGQAVTGNQVISGIKYTFGEDGALKQGSSSTGIDVSKWQGEIDWNAVKSAGINFVIIRVGYRGSETGVLVEDPYFKKNIKGATSVNLKVGVYFFSQAITEAEAVEEASMALSLTSGYKLTYPIFIDSENGVGNARANGLSKEKRTACVNAFCKTIQNAGKKAGVYASKNWFNTKLDTSQLNNYFIWVAQYNTTCTYGGRYNMWQYTSSGSIPGIKGKVDVNISYADW